MARRYGKAAQDEVKKEMKKFEEGKAYSGKGLAKVKSRKQAIAIGLSEARKKGDKLPKAPVRRKKAKPASRAKSTVKKATTKRSTKKGSKSSKRSK